VSLLASVDYRIRVYCYCNINGDFEFLFIATFAIIETFSKIRQLSRTVQERVTCKFYVDKLKSWFKSEGIEPPSTYKIVDL